MNQPKWSNGIVELRHGHALEVLAGMEANSVDLCVSSPPYWGLRDYGLEPEVWDGVEGCQHEWNESHDEREATASGKSRTSDRFYGDESRKFNGNHQKHTAGSFCLHCDARKGSLGLEPTPGLFVQHLVQVFREVRRVLKPTGSLWLDIGDTRLPSREWAGLPHKVLFALQDDGWRYEDEIVWCLSGGTKLLVKSQKGIIPMTIKDMVRLDPSTLQLWNGETWTQVTGWSKAESREGGLEIELRSGERIGCTPHHEWPVASVGRISAIPAEQLRVGDVIATTALPTPEMPEPVMIPPHIGQFIGLYIAEGNMDNDAGIRFSLHTDELDRFAVIKQVAREYGSTYRRHSYGNNGVAVVEGKIAKALVETYVNGHGSRYKHLTTASWQRDNAWLWALLDGYLKGDGHYDAKNDRWRIGFTQNDAWAADLRGICSRLGIWISLRRAQHILNGKKYPGWRGEIRFNRSTHVNNKERGEIVAIRKSRARKFWHIGVADEPHIFALASGVLTCNSKPNPMPGSQTNRTTRSHEMVFVLNKSLEAYYDQEAIREPMTAASIIRNQSGWNGNQERDYVGGTQHHFSKYLGSDAAKEATHRNKRSVWTIATEPMSWQFCQCGAVYDPAQYNRLRGGSNVRCTAEVEGDQECGATTWGYADNHFVCLGCGQVYTKGQHKKLPKAAVCPRCDRDDRWGSHFATFPEALVEPCILAGTSEKGVCSECGEPWTRVVGQSQWESHQQPGMVAQDVEGNPMYRGGGHHNDGLPHRNTASQTLGWTSTCSCDAPVKPAVVLDPFAGSGTTLLVAQKLGRRGIGIDANEQYLDLAAKRIGSVPLPMVSP